MARALQFNTNDIQNIYRTTFLVFNYKNLSSKLMSFQHDVLTRKTREISERNDFLSHWAIHHGETSDRGSEHINTISSALTFWAENGRFAHNVIQLYRLRCLITF